MCKQTLLLFFGLFLLTCGALYAPSAHAVLPCKASKPGLSVKTTTAPTKYIRTKSSADLTQMHGGQGFTVGGLGGGEVGFKTQSKFEISTQGNAACVKLKRVEVTFYAKPQIHIASNLGRSTCEYNAVMGHEKGHIRILRKFVREYSPKVKQELSRIAQRIDPALGPIKESQISNAQDKMQEQFMGKIEAYNNKIMPILSKRQQAFDSPREYERVVSKCRKWDKKLSKN